MARRSRSGSPEERVEDLTAGAGWLLSTDDGLEDATMTPKKPDAPSPVQRHVDQIVDDLSKGRVTPKQRGEIGKALQDAAVRSITRRVPSS